jgi:hypothetical protein
MNAQFRARKRKRVSADNEAWMAGRRRSAASEGVLAALRLSKSAQSADKVHFSDSSGCFFSPEIVLRVPFGSAHNRSLPGMIDHFGAISIIKDPVIRRKIVLMSPKIAEQEATRLITLPARGF